MAEIARIVRLLKAKGALPYTVIVASRASDPASLQYIAPYSGCTMAEYFRDAGQAALIVYDDLSRHADIYRQIALLLRRPVVVKLILEMSFIYIHVCLNVLLNYQIS